MSYRELYCSKFNGFLNTTYTYNEADFVILGYPYDATTTYLPGARFGPYAVRMASVNLEAFNPKERRDAEKFKIADIGDIDISYKNFKENISRVSKVVEEILKDDKIPIIIGGEHTATLGAILGIKEEITVIIFDAHLDLRDTYLDGDITHATVTRRIIEQPNVNNVIISGVRGVSAEEYKFAENNQKVTAIFMNDLQEKGNHAFKQKISEKIKNSTKIYVSVDIDVLDPSIAPSVGNPEPNGLTYRELQSLFEALPNRIIGFDVMEIAPQKFNDITAIYASKIILELIPKTIRSQ